MKKIKIISVLLFLFLFCPFYALLSETETVFVYGYGGVIDLPDGSRCYCPYPGPNVCAIIKKDVTGIPEYPHRLTYFEEGQPKEIVNVREAGKNEFGQPTWFVQPPSGKIKQQDAPIKSDQKREADKK